MEVMIAGNIGRVSPLVLNSIASSYSQPAQYLCREVGKVTNKQLNISTGSNMTTLLTGIEKLIPQETFTFSLV